MDSPTSTAAERTAGRADSARPVPVRTAILEAATELFEEQGPDRLSMRQIAKQIGYSATTIYHHYEDKDALLQAVCTAGFDEFGSLLEDAASRSDSFADRIRAVGATYVDFALAHPMHYDVMFVRPKPWTLPDGGEDPSFLGLVALIEAGQRSGEARPMDAREAAARLWSALHGVVSLALAMEGPVDIFETAAVRTRAAATIDLQLTALTP